MKTRLGYMSTRSLAGLSVWMLARPVSMRMFQALCFLRTCVPLAKSRCVEIKSWQRVEVAALL